MKEKKLVISLILFISIFFILNVSSLPIEDNGKITFGHLIKIEKVNIPQLAPGEIGIINITLKNGAEYEITDVQAKLNLPGELQFLNDVNEIKISKINPKETKELNYRVIALPNSLEGVYSSSLNVDYTVHFGANAINLGEAREDNFSFGIILRSFPSVFMYIDSSNIYSGENVGEANVKFVNNGTSNIKFLNVKFERSNDYEIISQEQNYIGDLDSDDFQSIVLKFKLKNKKDSIIIPVSIDYKDSLNGDYNQKLSANLKIWNKSEITKSNNNYLYMIIILVIIAMLATYFIYKKRKKSTKKFF